jgi:hypothetical protein
MSEVHYFEQPPPRSWDQFEELCADLFEAAWNDPGLVRHGRAGQKQHGVDIVARRGSQYPIGLQCKKKAKWPAKRLTISEIDAEISEARNFYPPLKAFFLLTTAEDDAKLQAHVREVNEKLSQQGLFKTVLLGWQEIVRRASRYEQVAKKHFPGFGSADLVSPLLVTWYTSHGKLELSGAEWNLRVEEAAEDFFDWPNGHVIVRQREADEITLKLQDLAGSQSSPSMRSQRLELRKKLRRLLIVERRVQEIIRVVFSHQKFRFHFMTLWEGNGDLAIVTRSLIERCFDTELSQAHMQKIWVHPPSPQLLSGYRDQFSVADMDIPIHMPEDIYLEIERIKRQRFKKYGKSLTETVDELPISARAKYVVPAIILRVQRIMDEERKTVLEMDAAGYLDLANWKVTY